METLSKHFRELTKAAFASYGFGQAELLWQWPDIVGEDLAQLCRPQRIKWPRAAAAGKNSAGTLHVRAMAGRGLDVQQAVPLIIERVNRFLGYGAIMAVKIEQSHEQPLAPQHQSLPGPLPPLPEGISEPGLAEALQRLGQGVATRSETPRRRSPQAR